MRKIIFLFIIIIFSNIISFAQVPDWLWAKRAGGIKSEQGNSIATDISGNIYITGFFDSKSIKFDSITLTNTDTVNFSADVFIVKTNSSGQVIWAKKSSGIISDIPYGIATDLNGNTFIIGEFQSDTIIFDSFHLANAGTGNIFIVKYNSSGNVVWAKGVGGIGTDFGYGITTDLDGNIYVTGGFLSPAIKFDTITLTNSGTGCTANDVFIAKYDATGKVIWAKRAGEKGNEFGRSIVTDNAENIYLTGQFSSPAISFDSIILTNFASKSKSKNTFSSKTIPSDIFVAKYDSSGIVLWAENAGGSKNDYSSSIACDNDVIYITGGFSSDTATFDSIVLLKSFSDGMSDVFIAKYDSSGNALWTATPVSEGIRGDNAGNSIAADYNGNVYVTGYFNDSLVTFGSIPLLNAGMTDIFTVQYNSAGNAAWAERKGGTYSDNACGIAADYNGNIILTGTFLDSTITFGAYTLTNAGSADLFIAKFGSDSIIGIHEWDNTSNISVFPNPASDFISIKIDQESEIEIFNMQGQLMKNIHADKSLVSIDVSDLTQGIYLVKVNANTYTAVKKFIKE